MNADINIITNKLKDFFGFDTFKGGQEEVILNLLEGNNTFVLMPTGGGKSLCYQLPALIMEGTAIIISPLIALMKNQVDLIRGFVSENEGIAHFLNSSLNRSQLNEVKQHLLEGKTKLLYVAPESLTKEENINLLKDLKISFYAVDEAHCISEWGHDFRPEYRRIRQIVDEIQPAPIIALTATATPKVQSDILKILNIQDAKIFKSSFNRPNLYYEVKDKVEPQKDIIRYIKQHPNQSGIIYCLSRKKVEELSQILNINGIKSLPYHAGLDAKTRSENQDLFLNEDVNVIVATIAFGMGIDKPNVRFVIHYDIPKSIEGYYQETGRAGRDGLQSECITYYSDKDVKKLEKFILGKPISEQEIGKQLLQETASYAESGICRRQLLMNYFGETYPHQNCGNCDNCKHPKNKFEAKDYIKTVIELIDFLPEKFKAEHLANILSGTPTALVKSYKHDKIEFYKADDIHNDKFWIAVIQQGIIDGIFDKDIESYGLISITPKGYEFYKQPYSIMMPEDRKFSNLDDDDDAEDAATSGQGGCSTGDPALLSMLKSLRKDIAKQHGLQPWVIFSDPSLEDMAITYPMTLEELKNCQGVGDGKAKKFGQPCIDLIKKYVEENEIIRPDDFIIKTIASKSANKVYIIQCIDRQILFEDIAAAKGLELDELISEIETIVESGTKLNIKYYLDECLDQDTIDEIYEYFKEEATSDSVQEAVNNLGPSYEEIEIRLIRIYFISQEGN